jgi:hypothetical protein
MTNFFRKLSREKLYKQWVDNAGLSPDDLPPEMKKDTGELVEDDDTMAGASSPRREFRPGMGLSFDSLLTSRNLRFIGILALIIVILLVVLSVITTVLIMRSC